ncbi:hypothetical protein BGZ83_000737 [Gryganskiella cystojenkinii]|nr:hypothetical protein BGZ83_000737 [Gryganskiella cystojenkinii]
MMAQLSEAQKQKSPLMSLSEVEAKKKSLVDSIFKDWHLLNHIILRHEALIQKRWLKKNRQQRKALLLSLWPNMPISHQADIRAVVQRRRHGDDIMIPETASAQDPYYWPHINQEDLLKPKILLIFLNARARHNPSSFARSDLNTVKLPPMDDEYRKWKQLDPFYRMVFDKDAFTTETFGRTYALENPGDDSKHARMMKFRDETPLQAYLILKVQRRLYHFLLDCCLQILHDIPKESLVSAESPIEPEPPTLSLIEGGVCSLTALTTMAPYRAPANLDFDRLQDLIAAKRSAVEDHIWSLREDPGYFTDVLMEELFHRPETIRDVRGQVHPLATPNHYQDLRKTIVGATVSKAYLDLIAWNDLHSLIGTTMILQEKYKTEIKSRDDLPEELLLSFLDLEIALVCYIGNHSERLQQLIKSSPPWRAFFARASSADKSSIELKRNPMIPDSSWDATRLQLMSIFETIWDSTTVFELSLGFILDALNVILEFEGKEAKELLTPRVTLTLEELSIMSECQRQIKLFQPWASRFIPEHAKRSGTLGKRMDKRRPLLDRLADAHDLFDYPDVDPTSDQFFYPIDKRRTKETTAAMQQAERNLDVFWNKVDNSLLRKIDPNGKDTLIKIFDQRKILYRTLDWIEPEPRSKQHKKLYLESAADGITRPLSQLELDNEHLSVKDDNARTQQPSASKSKVKTRGIASTTNTAFRAECSESNKGYQLAKAKAKHTIMVDRRSLKVFSILFYQPSINDQPGEILWNDFLHAMTKAGFAVEKLYGSVWHFSPLPSSNTFDVWDRSIQFHEPHPSAKIPFRTARRFGRRLFRAYGWHGDMFKVEEL